MFPAEKKNNVTFEEFNSHLNPKTSRVNKITEEYVKLLVSPV